MTYSEDPGQTAAKVQSDQVFTILSVQSVLILRFLRYTSL